MGTPLRNRSNLDLFVLNTDQVAAPIAPLRSRSTKTYSNHSAHGWVVVEVLEAGGKPKPASRVYQAQSAAEAFADLARKSGRRVDVVFR